MRAVIVYRPKSLQDRLVLELEVLLDRLWLQLDSSASRLNDLILCSEYREHSVIKHAQIFSQKLDWSHFYGHQGLAIIAEVNDRTRCNRGDSLPQTAALPRWMR
jgi:hypothetical protein